MLRNQLEALNYDHTDLMPGSWQRAIAGTLASKCVPYLMRTSGVCIAILLYVWLADVCYEVEL